MTLRSTTIATKPLRQQPSAWKPHGYQKKAIRFILQNSCAGLLLDPGLGKTSIILASLKILKQEKLASKVLIVAPLRVCYSVWPKEITKWKDFAELTAVILHGKDKEKNLEKEADIYLINPEGLAWLLGRNFKALGFDILVIDESSKFKNASTQRFKILRPVLPNFRRRYILTGSPAPNGLLDLFGQIFILDLGAALGRYITHYRNNYFYPSGYGGYEWKIQDDGEARIQEKLKPLTLRLAAEDHLELPEMVFNRIEITLPKKAREAYDEMEKDMVAFLELKQKRVQNIVAVNAASASGKCRQIANGGVYDEDGTVHDLHVEKAQAVADLIDELNGTPALVAYEFQHDLERLLKVLGKSTPYIGGGVSAKRSSEIEAEWNRGSIPVLLGHPAAMGHGLNLQNAGNHVIWHSLTWNYEYYDQFNRRILRQGSKHSKVFVHHVVATDTIDEAVLGALAGKKKTQNDLLDALKAYVIKRL